MARQLVKKSSKSVKVSRNGNVTSIGETSKDKLLPQKDFLAKYGITEKKFKATGLKWKDLEEIYKDYLKIKNSLDETGQSVVRTLFTEEAKDSGVHSVKYRVKDPHGLIEKIIRHKIINPEKQNITLANYRSEVTDLIGVRALHVFKQDWYGVGNFIRSKWDLKKTHKQPTVYHRKGDSIDFLNECKQGDCKVKEHPKGYRSIHFIIQLSTTKETHYVEIQVRTIFEEGWSEIDHKIRYSSKKKDQAHPLEAYLLILNSISGSADDMGKILKQNKVEIDKAQYDSEDKGKGGSYA